MGLEEGVLDLDSFVAEQLKLLGLERNAEIAESLGTCLMENQPSDMFFLQPLFHNSTEKKSP